MRWPRLLAAHELDAMFELLPHSSPVPPVTVSGFSQYKTRLADLPPNEQAKVDAVAERIVAGYRPARLPIVGVLLVGHADQDLSRGAVFEQNISVERAQRTLEGLCRALTKRADSQLVALRFKEIAMRAVGSGARQRVLLNPLNEAQRASNRRVEIFLAEAVAPNLDLPASDLPSQKALGPTARIVRSAQVSVSFVPFTRSNITTPLAGSPRFVEGKPQRPNIRHDHGFLDDGSGNIDPKKRQPPTAQDFALKERWKMAAQLKSLVSPDLKDAISAYAHFLIDNNGAPRTFDYESFLKDDTNGQTVLQSAIDDTRAGVLDIFDKKFPAPASAPRRDQFSVTSGPVTVGRLTPDHRYPYPITENWQKTIGGHALWLSADVLVDSTPQTRSVQITMTLHAEDMYNFNPGGGDGATGIADAENGRFEITGLGSEFLQTGTAARKIKFSVPNAKQADNRVVPPDQQITA